MIYLKHKCNKRSSRRCHGYWSSPVSKSSSSSLKSESFSFATRYSPSWSETSNFRLFSSSKPRTFSFTEYVYALYSGTFDTARISTAGTIISRFVFVTPNEDSVTLHRGILFTTSKIVFRFDFFFGLLKILIKSSREEGFSNTFSNPSANLPPFFLAFSSAFAFRLFAFSRKHIFAHFFLFSSNVAMKNDAKSSTNSFTFCMSAFSIVSSFSNNVFILMRFNFSISCGASSFCRSPSAASLECWLLPLLFFDEGACATPFLTKSSLKTSFLSNNFTKNSCVSISYVTGFPRWSSILSRNSRFFFFGLLFSLLLGAAEGALRLVGASGCGTARVLIRVVFVFFSSSSSSLLVSSRTAFPFASLTTVVAVSFISTIFVIFSPSSSSSSSASSKAPVFTNPSSSGSSSRQVFASTFFSIFLLVVVVVVSFLATIVAPVIIFTHPSRRRLWILSSSKNAL